MTEVDVAAYIEERSALIEAWLEDFVPPADEPPRELHAAMRHLLFPGGKRLRPLLAMAAAESAGARPEAALPLAAAVELIHTYSLVHDDLPCMDDDDLRRGRPTVHVAFDEATAVLAGDALQALAFEAAVAATPDAPERCLRAARDLVRAAGSRGIVGGQFDDIAATSAEAAPSPAELESIHQRKSAALIAAAVVTGASVAGASDELLDRLQKFGLDVGIAFQITDDRLDGDGLAASVGDSVAAERAEVLLEGALASIEDLGESAEPLRELACYAVRRSR
ncbi:MAG: polyprenyl synthetase family protein [Myxococcota bacterium]|nr:polyprenyl synthetase family protein [Myxococcota bacterium]